MATEKYVFPMTCFGRNTGGKNALQTAVSFDLIMTRPEGDSQSISVSAENCPYITGSDKQRCKASYAPGIDKVGAGIICPYTLNIPGGVDYLLSQMKKSE